MGNRFIWRILSACIAVVIVAKGYGSVGRASGKGEGMKVVTVLRDSDCGSDAIGRVKDVAKRLGIEVTIEEIIVETEEQIQERHFLGSPTVHIKGLDIDPEARGLTSYAMT